MFVAVSVVLFVGWCALLLVPPLFGACNPIDAQIRSGEFADDTATAYEDALFRNNSRRRELSVEAKTLPIRALEANNGQVDS